MIFTVQRHRLTRKLRFNYRTIECFPFPYTLPPQTKGLFTTVPFPHLVWLLKKKLQGIPKGKKQKTKTKTKKPTKTKNPQFEETEKTSQPDMAGLLELSDWEFNATMINMLRALIDKVDSMQEQMGNVNREMEILRKNQKEMLEIKTKQTKTPLEQN